MDLTKDWGKEAKPQSRHAITALSFLVYDLNKCAATRTNQNVKERSKLMEIRKSIVKHDDAYVNLYEALPALEITEELARSTKKKKPTTII